jgi:azurin
MPETNSTGPGMSNKHLVEMLIRSRLFRDYEGVFTKATGLPLALRPLEYWQLEHHQKTNENRFCALLAEKPATLAVCLQSDAEIIEHTGDVPRTETCPFGLTETAVPVRLGGKTIGFLRIGQVLRRSAIQTDKSRAASKLKECGVAFAGTIRKAWEATPIIPKDKYGAIVRLLTFFGEQLSALINQIVLESQNAEPPLVQRARAYIEQHKMEPLSLAAVAQVSGASVFHFCKVFKKSTGLRFTDYVARIRLEDAKAQLLNPSRRISEVAYDVGFQSLTQFNRMFKRIFGPVTHRIPRPASCGPAENQGCVKSPPPIGIAGLALFALAAALLSCSRNVAPPKVVEITGDDFMKFSVTSFDAKPGQKVTVRLKNIGELPKEATAHNWVLLAKEAYAPKFVELGTPHPERDYVAFEQEFYVLAKTKLLGPGESDSVTFNAPGAPGAYDYICTFPEHYAGGMKGVMTVRP